MKPKTAKITIRARGYGKSITLNDSQTDLVLKVLGNEILSMEEKNNSNGPLNKEHQILYGIWNAIKEGPK